MALEKLKQIAPYKYKDAMVEGCEKPDIQNLKLSIGVEVTTCDFNEVYMWNKYYGKYLLEVFKMEGIKPIRYSEIQRFCIGKYAKANINDFIKEELFIERKGKLKQLKSYKDFQILNSHDKLYCKSDINWIIDLDDDLKIINISPPAYFLEHLSKKLQNTLKSKENKFKNYKKFSENNLYIHNITGSIEEFKEFEANTNFKNCCFKYIYLSDFWSKEKQVYIIDTSKQKYSFDDILSEK